MKISVSFIALLAMNFCVASVCIGSENRVKQDAKSLLENYGKTDVSNWDAAHKNAVFSEIWKFASEGDDRLRRQSIISLVNQGDSKAIKELINTLNDGDALLKLGYWRYIERHCIQPELIPALSSDLFREEGSGYRLVASEFLVESQSVITARIIRSILLKADQVPEKTKEWAKGIDATSSEMLRMEIRRWYQKNQTHLEAHEFDKLIPPIEETEVSRDQPLRPNDETELDPKKRRPEEREDKNGNG